MHLTYIPYLMEFLIMNPGGGNSSSTLVPMREQENAYKGVFLRDERVYARIRAYTRKGGGVKSAQNKKKGVFPKYGRKNA